MTTTQPLGCSEEESAGGVCAPPTEAKILSLAIIAIKDNEAWTLSFIISNNNTYSVHAPFKSQKQQNFETIFLNVEK